MCLEGVYVRIVVSVLCGTDTENEGEGPPPQAWVWAHTLRVPVLWVFAFRALL